MRIFLPGASGLVGAAFARAAARRGHEVIGTVGSFVGQLEGLARQVPLDLGTRETVNQAVLDAFPDAIVNCAAISEPAVCETKRELAEAMNVALPQILAELAHHLSARFIHISSEQVFDGEQRTPYREVEEVKPINLYGRQKVASERAVCATAPKFTAVVRAPLLMGDSPGGRRGLHERMLGDWSAGKAARLYTDEYRQPCTAENLAEVLLELTERPDVCGVYHWAGTELLSRYELGLRVRDHFRLNETIAPIVAVARGETPEVAKQRQACLALDISSLAGRLKTRPQNIAEQLGSLRVPRPCRDWYLAQA